MSSIDRLPTDEIKTILVQWEQTSDSDSQNLIFRHSNGAGIRISKWDEESAIIQASENVIENPLHGESINPDDACGPIESAEELKEELNRFSKQFT